EALHRSHLADLPQLVPKIFQRKSVTGKRAGGDVLSFLFIDSLLSAFDQRKNVAHAENARHNAVRMKRLESVIFFAHANKLDRRPCNLPDRKRRATPSVAIHFGEHYARKR